MISPGAPALQHLLPHCPTSLSLSRTAGPIFSLEREQVLNVGTRQDVYDVTYPYLSPSEPGCRQILIRTTVCLGFIVSLYFDPDFSRQMDPPTSHYLPHSPHVFENTLRLVPVSS